MDTNAHKPSLVAEFDNIINSYEELTNQSVNNDKKFLKYIQETEKFRSIYVKAFQDKEELQKKLDDSNNEIKQFDTKLTVARKMLDHERCTIRKLNSEKYELLENFERVKEALPECFPEKQQVMAILNTVANRYSDSNYSLMERNISGYSYPDLNVTYLSSDVTTSNCSNSTDTEKFSSYLERPRRYRSYSTEEFVQISSRSSSRRASLQSDNGGEQKLATTVLPLTKFSKIEKIQNKRERYNNKTDIAILDLLYEKPHSIIGGIMFRTEVCCICVIRIHFREKYSKCTNCRAVVHNNCLDKLPIPCIQLPLNPGSKKNLSNLVGKTKPMIPGLVIHCVKQIEKRGFGELLYNKTSVSNKKSHLLMQQFLDFKSFPDLSQFSLSEIASCLKQFFNNLEDTLIPKNVCNKLISIKSSKNRQADIMCLIETLPQPNKDTLAFLVLHLQNVANNSVCKINKQMLSQIFGPIIVAIVVTELINIINSTKLATSLVEEFLNIPGKVWLQLLSNEKK